jgi:hypothetical protein
MLTNIEEAAAVDSCAGGVDLITGNNTTMSGANDWTDYGICGAFDVNSTYPGKLYMLGNGSADGVFRAGIITPGRSYRVTLKARLVAGASTTIKAGNYSSDNPLNYMEFTPTSVETEYTDDFIGDGTNFVIGINTGFDGVAFTIDDVTLVECP